MSNIVAEIATQPEPDYKVKIYVFVSHKQIEVT